MRFILFIGGAAALAWQVIWSHHLGLALGASARGVALTVATAMLGMTLGALLCGRFLRGNRPLQPILIYGSLELAIGFFALLPSLAEKWIMSADAMVHRQWPDLATPFTVLALACSIGPACLVMGATLPVMGLIGRMLVQPLSKLYGWNTAGAAAGAILASFFLIPALGLSGSAVALCLTHLVLALACAVIMMQKRLPGIAPEIESLSEPEPSKRTGGKMRKRDAALIVFISGLATFILEVAWFRALRSAWFSTADSLAVMLFCFLVALAAGAALAPRVRRLGIPLWGILGAASILVILSTSFIAHFDSVDAFQRNGAARQIFRIFGGLLVMGPPVLLIGIALPTLLDEVRSPRSWAALYGINTLGAVIGANLAGWVLLKYLGPSPTAWTAGFLLLIGACFVCGSWRIRGTLTALAMATLLVVFPMDEKERNREPGAERSLPGSVEVIERRYGPDSTISVVGFPGGKALFINGFATTAQAADPHLNYMDAIGRIPMLLHPDPQDALVICFGTGQTAHAVRDENAERLDLVDLNAAVFEMAPHFDSNHLVLEDPRTTVNVMDGRAWLRRSTKNYDVVTLEPMPPFFSGSNALYSTDFYDLVHSRLRPGGMLAQWFPMHLMTPGQAESIAAAFVKIFPQSILWIDPDSPSKTGLPQQGILIGRRAGKEELEPVRFWEQWPGFLRGSGSGSRPITEAEARQRVILEPAALRQYAGDAIPVTDDNLSLEYGISNFRSSSLRIEESIQEIHRRIHHQLAFENPQP